MADENHVTDKQIEKYLQHKGIRCLHCGSNELDAGRTETDIGIAWQGVACNTCGGEWTDLYDLAGVRDCKPKHFNGRS